MSRRNRPKKSQNGHVANIYDSNFNKKCYGCAFVGKSFVCTTSNGKCLKLPIIDDNYANSITTDNKANYVTTDNKAIVAEIVSNGDNIRVGVGFADITNAGKGGYSSCSD